MRQNAVRQAVSSTADGQMLSSSLKVSAACSSEITCPSVRYHDPESVFNYGTERSLSYTFRFDAGIQYNKIFYSTCFGLIGHHHVDQEYKNVSQLGWKLRSRYVTVCVLITRNVEGNIFGNKTE
jgi:hypothetical protein